MKKPFAKQQIIAVTMALLLSTAAHANNLIDNEVSGNLDYVEQSIGDGSTAELDVGVLEANDGNNNRVDNFGLRSVEQTAGNGSYVKAEVGKIRAKSATDNRVSGYIENIRQEVGDNSKALIQVGVLDAGPNGTATGNDVHGSMVYILQGQRFMSPPNNASFKARIGVITPSSATR